MALTAQEWKGKAAQLETARGLPKDVLVDKLLKEDPPTGLFAWREDPLWGAHLHIFMESEFATEQLDFIDAVDGYRNSGMPTAQQIYDRYVRVGTADEVNVSVRMKKAMADALADGNEQAVKDALDEMYDETSRMIDGGPYLRFKDAAKAVREEWSAGEVRHVTRPEEVVARPPDITLVNKVNQQVLKDLEKNESATFYQLGDLVIIDANVGDGQHGLAWIRDQKGVDEGTITMVERGGAFSRGSIRAEGVVDRPKFGAAIAKVSKKEIKYS